MRQFFKRPPESSRAALVPILLLLVAFVLRAAVGAYWPSNYQPDEIFQTQEPAHRMAFGYGVVTWEWRDGIRSYVYPFLLSLIMRAAAWGGAGSPPYLIAVALCMAAFSLTIVWFCYQWAYRVSGRTAALISGFTAAIWFTLVYFGPKTFSELAATDALLAGLLLGSNLSGGSTKWRLPVAGSLCGLAFALRPQFAPAVLFAVLWMYWHDPRRSLPRLAAGVAVPLLVFGVVDAFTLGYPFASFVRYVWVNVGQGKAQVYGTSPWYAYAPQLVFFCGPLLIPAILGLRKSPFLGWLLLVLVGSHSLIAHKEFRFIFPAVPLVITLAGIGCVEIANSLRRVAPRLTLLRPSLAIAALLACIAACTVVLGSRFDRWHFASEGLVFAHAASRDPAVCGVGYYGVLWPHAGGYTHLHRPVPMLFPESQQSLTEDAAQFNLLLTHRRLASAPPGFVLESCAETTCTYRREGSCSPPGRDEVNLVLRRKGQ